MSWKPQTTRFERQQNAKDMAWLGRDKPIEQQTAGRYAPRATSNDPCPRCEVPGFRGCKHQLPFEGAGPNPAAEKRGRRSTYSRGDDS